MQWDEYKSSQNSLSEVSPHGQLIFLESIAPQGSMNIKHSLHVLREVGLWRSTRIKKQMEPN